MYRTIGPFRVVFSERGRRDVLALRNGPAGILISWIETHLEACDAPWIRGSEFGGNVSGRRYRVGRYSILTQISRNKITVLAIIHS